MAYRSIKAGATSQSINLFIQDTTKTNGGGLTGLVYNTSGLTAYYSFSGAAAGSNVITLATLASLSTAWTSGGFLEIDSTHMPGHYRFDIPNAALVSGNGPVVSIHFRGATNMAETPLVIELTGWDNQNAINGGMTALPATACTTNASLLTSGTGTDQLSVSSGKVLLQATQTGVTIPTVTTVTNQLTGSQIATAIWTDFMPGDFSALGSIGKSLYTSGNAPGATNGLALVGSNMGIVSQVTGNVLGNVNGSVGSISSVTFPTNFGSMLISTGGLIRLDLTQPLSTPRNVRGVADTSLTTNDALHCGIAVEAGVWAIVGTTWTVQTPAGTTLQAFILDNATAPTQRS
jgi:hypothetical protein